MPQNEERARVKQTRHTVPEKKGFSEKDLTESVPVMTNEIALFWTYPDDMS